MRHPCPAEPHKPLKSQQASTQTLHTAMPSPKLEGWAAAGVPLWAWKASLSLPSPLPSPRSPGLAHPGKQRSNPGAALGLAQTLHWGGPAQPAGCSWHTLLPPSPCHRHPPLPSTLNTPPEASACFCANKSSFYPALCSQCCLQHPITPASALISAHMHSSLSLHPFLSWLPITQFLWTLFSTWGTCTRLLTPRECNSCSLLGFPVLSNALSIYMHSSSTCLLKGSLTSFLLDGHGFTATGKETSLQLVPCCSLAHSRTLSRPWLYHQVKI